MKAQNWIGLTEITIYTFMEISANTLYSIYRNPADTPSTLVLLLWPIFFFSYFICLCFLNLLANLITRTNLLSLHCLIVVSRSYENIVFLILTLCNICFYVKLYLRNRFVLFLQLGMLTTWDFICFHYNIFFLLEK